MWQYTFSRGPQKHHPSAIFRADESCIQRLFWTEKGTFVWHTIRHISRVKL